jgi:sialidase-1
MKTYPFKLNFALSPKVESIAQIADFCEPLETQQMGPFISNTSGQLLSLNSQHAYISDDQGLSWQSYPLFTANEQHKITDSHSLLLHSSGRIICAFPDYRDFHFNWRKKTNLPTKNSKLYAYVMVSDDGGKSWSSPKLICKGYMAATTTMIELRDGTVLFSAQNLDYEAGRHYSLTYRSTDQGDSWQASNKLDIGGQGHHAGCYEGTLLEQADRVLFLIRTNLDWFWEAYSYDSGKTWSEVRPGNIEASSSPAKLLRLNSGRVLMAYNPLSSLLDESYHLKRRAGLFSEVAASWYRAELVVRVSEDDGHSWGQPIVVAHCDNAWLAYCYLFESSPGKIWLTTMQSQLKIQFLEKDLLR